MTRPSRLPRRQKDSLTLLPCRSSRSSTNLSGVSITADGVITLPDGQVRAILAVEPVNFECRGQSEQDALAAQFVSLAGSLAPGQTLQVLVESRPSDAEAILPRVFARLTPRTEALREFARVYQPWLSRQLGSAHVPDLRFYLIVSLVPPRGEIIVRGRPRRREQEQQLARRNLEQAVDEVSRHLKRMNLGVHRLSRVAALRALWDGVHPAEDPCPPEEVWQAGPLPGDPSPSGPRIPVPGRLRRHGRSRVAQWVEGEGETLAAEQVAAWWLRRCLCDVRVDERPDNLRVSSRREGAARLARSLFLLAPPELTDPGWLDPLIGLDCPFRLSLHLEGLDRKAERQRLKRRRRSLNVLTSGAIQSGGTADVDMESAQAEARQQALETLDPASAILRMGLYLTVFAHDQERLAEYTERAFSLLTSRLGAEAGRGIGHQLPLWQAALPLGIDAAERRYRVRSETVGNAFPFLTHNPGMPSGFPLGFTSVGHELVLFDPADPSLPNSLMNIVGRSGSGKTFLAQKLAMQTVLAGGRATVIDRAGHYEQLLAVAGGSLARLGAPNPPALNLWDHEGAAASDKIGFVVDAHEIMLARQPGDRLDPLVRSVLERGVRAVYRQSQSEAAPTERALVGWLEAEAAGAADEHRRELLLGLAARLEPFVREGRYAALLDRQTSVDLEAPLLVFDLDGLSPGLHALVMFLIAESVDRRAKRGRRQEGGIDVVRELLVIDEGWFLVRYAAAGAWIEELARRGRHWGLFLVFITQQLSDLVDDPTAATLFNAASVQMLFRQKDQRSGEGEGGLSWLSEALGLSAEEVAQLSRLSGVRGEYTEMLLLRESKDAATARRGVVQVFCHPLEYWLYTSEPLRDVPYRRRMIAALGGDVWAAVRACAAGQDVSVLPLESEARVANEQEEEERRHDALELVG